MVGWRTNKFQLPRIRWKPAMALYHQDLMSPASRLLHQGQQQIGSLSLNERQDGMCGESDNDSPETTHRLSNEIEWRLAVPRFSIEQQRPQSVKPHAQEPLCLHPPPSISACPDHAHRETCEPDTPEPSTNSASPHASATTTGRSHPSLAETQSCTRREPCFLLSATPAFCSSSFQNSAYTSASSFCNGVQPRRCSKVSSVKFHANGADNTGSWRK